MESGAVSGDTSLFFRRRFAVFGGAEGRKCYDFQLG